MSSVIQALMQLAPTVGSPSAVSQSSSDVHTDGTVSSGIHTPPDSSTMDRTATVPEEAGDVYSDPEDAYVEAPEQQPQDDDMMHAQPEEMENMQQGLGDVHDNVTAFQTPDRKRHFEVDTKTITRPKKTSPSNVALPEIFAKENQEDTQFRPLSASTPIMQQQQTASSSSSVSPRPAASAAAAATPAAPPTQAAAAAGGATGTRPAAAAPPPARAARQQTMTVSSALSRDVKMAIEHEKSSFVDEAAAARMEARLMALVLDKEREWQDKHSKLGQIMVAQKAEADDKARQALADIEGLSAALVAATEAMACGFPDTVPSSSSFGGGAGSSLPHLPPAPVLAAMTSDKLAELARLKKENENLEIENTKLHNQYNSLYDTYSQQRTVIPALKQKNDELERGVRAERERFEKLKRHAEAKLEEASGENESMRAAITRAEKEHEANTLAIRMRLKQRDAEVADLENSVAQKRKQVADLKEICAELIAKADANVSDIE